MPYVYSTCTSSCDYVEYKKPEDTPKNVGHNEVVRRVTINGGHGVPNKHFVTPIGVATQVSDEELEFLLRDPNFQRHMKAGHITVDTNKVDPEIKVRDMAQKDGSALLTPADLEKEVSKDSEMRNTFRSKGRK